MITKDISRIYYEVHKSPTAFQWEVWKCSNRQKLEIEKVFDWQYQANAYCRSLNTQAWLDRANEIQYQDYRI